MERIKYSHVDSLIKRYGGIRAMEEWRAIRSYIVEAGQPAHNSRYATALEDSYGVLNRMGGALEGCRAELAIVIERLNAAKAPHCT